MSRPTIHCPDCHRELYHLRRPQCIWCGARISAEPFEEVAAPPSNSPQVPPMLPPTISTGYGIPSFGGTHRLFEGNPFPLINKSVTPWEKKLRIVGAALFALLMLARLAEILWSLWRLHQTMPGH